MALINVKVEKVIEEAEGVKAFLLAKSGFFNLPHYTAGSHIDVHCGKGIIRQYSLCGMPDDRKHYMIAVKREDTSRGGSEQMHDEITIGQALEIGSPRNNFPLDEAASHVTLLAGGIGITPIIAMADRLHTLSIPFKLHYFSRSDQHAAFRDRMQSGGYASSVKFHFGLDVPQTTECLRSIFKQRPTEGQTYICGPGPFMDSAEKIAGQNWPTDSIHLERFSANPALTGGTTKPFTLELAQSGLTFEIGANETILNVLEENDFEAPFSCEQGVCGTCVTDVIAGTPEHRDSFLNEKDRASGKRMCICVSRAAGRKITLDL